MPHLSLWFSHPSYEQVAFVFQDFKNGINTGGRIEFVWLFGIIGFFVLLLACINFMNLSTARSKNGQRTGIRKAIGSVRSVDNTILQRIIISSFIRFLSVALTGTNCNTSI